MHEAIGTGSRERLTGTLGEAGRPEEGVEDGAVAD